MQRVLVIGQAGSGKSTLSRRLSATLGVPHLELDAFFQAADWQRNPHFESDVAAATQAPGWVVDGNYGSVRDLLWSRADTIVWLDLHRVITEARVLRRTARRIATREVLWNGNVERLRTVVDADHPIVWTWTTWHHHRRVYEERLRSWEGQLIRLRTPREVRLWTQAST